MLEHLSRCLTNASVWLVLAFVLFAVALLCANKLFQVKVAPAGDTTDGAVGNKRQAEDCWKGRSSAAAVCPPNARQMELDTSEPDEEDSSRSGEDEGVPIVTERRPKMSPNSDTVATERRPRIRTNDEDEGHSEGAAIVTERKPPRTWIDKKHAVVTERRPKEAIGKNAIVTGRGPPKVDKGGSEDEGRPIVTGRRPKEMDMRQNGIVTGKRAGTEWETAAERRSKEAVVTERRPQREVSKYAIVTGRRPKESASKHAIVTGRRPPVSRCEDSEEEDGR